MKYRKSFPKCSSHDVVLEEIRKKLLSKGVCSSLNDLRCKRRNLQELYRRKKREGKTCHQFFGPGSVIFDDANLSVLKNTKYDPDREEEEEGDEDDPDDPESDASAYNQAVLKFAKGLYIPHFLPCIIPSFCYAPFNKISVKRKCLPFQWLHGHFRLQRPWLDC